MDYRTENPVEDEINPDQALTNLKGIFGILDIDFNLAVEEEQCFYPDSRAKGIKIIKKEKRRVARVKIIFNSEEQAKFFGREVVKKTNAGFIEKDIVTRTGEDFENIKCDNDTLQFDLTLDCLRILFDTAAPPFPPVNWGLIEKYGGIRTLVLHLWYLAEKKCVVDIPSGVAGGA